MAAEGRFDYLLMESTGISEPLPEAETFTFRDEEGRSQDDLARLDTMVTVADTCNFLRDYASRDSLGNRQASLGDEDERTVVDLLIEQVEFCDVIVLNKTDLASAGQLAELQAILRSLNPRADIVSSEFGRVPLDRVLDTCRFDFDAAAEAPGWLAELRGEHVPETEAYGIDSFIYRARRPFHPQRLWQWMGRRGAIQGLFLAGQPAPVRHAVVAGRRGGAPFLRRLVAGGQRGRNRSLTQRKARHPLPANAGRHGITARTALAGSRRPACCSRWKRGSSH
ncbi:GTP-binding protein [Chromobacterium piscinae]|uniref:GTP-binding protein n=1 Tax=Chromobacterium piscinae TaxID=686831 RepID=A0ABV0HAL8_9NEIS|nr:hypothetical protein [Chromobacterium vaccinii]MBX9356941.1 hypothetical protein [Chromobacterium vaccinii]